MTTILDTPKHRSFGHAVKWAYVMTLGRRGITMLITFVLAAVLGPRDFGTVAMAMAYIVVIEMFVTQGMGTAIIQRENLTESQLDGVFWLILAVSAALTAISVLLSGWWAAVNDLPDLMPVIIVLSLSLPISGLTVVQQALLQRTMDFRNLALLTGIASLVGGAVGITMAFNGWGVWSLAAQHLVRTALATAIMWRVSDWRPRFRFRFAEIRPLFGFSGGMLASQLGVYVAGQADAILMGIFFGPIAVGLYRIAERIMSMLLEVATRSIQVVALPQFSRLQQKPDELKASARSCIRLSATLAIPAMGLLAAVSDPLVLILGEEWAPASIVLQVLVVMGGTKAITLFAGPLLLARGRSSTVAVLVWILGIATAAGIAGIGVVFSERLVEEQIAAVALMRTGLFVLLHGVISLIITQRLCRLTIRELLWATGPAIGAALAAIVTAAAIDGSGAISEWPPLFAAPALGAPAAAAALATLLILDSGLRQMVARALRQVTLRHTARTSHAWPTRHD